MTDLDGIDMHTDLLTYAEAAHYSNIDPATLRQWKRRGYLTSTGTAADGRPLFTLIAVARAQTAAERADPRRKTRLA